MSNGRVFDVTSEAATRRKSSKGREQFRRVRGRLAPTRPGNPTRLSARAAAQTIIRMQVFHRRERPENKAEIFAIPRTVQTGTGAVREKFQRGYPVSQQVCEKVVPARVVEPRTY